MASNNNISKQTFECFICQKQGFPNERVYLAGKTADGKTIYLAEDGVIAHKHKFREKTSQAQPPTTLTTAADTIISKLDEIIQKLDRLLAIEGQ
jgi:hypothetical protein